MMKIQFVFWLVTPYSNVVGYICFRGLYCFHVQGKVSGVWKWT